MADLDKKLCISRFLDGVPGNYIDRVILQTCQLKAWGQNFAWEDVIQNVRLALLRSFREGRYKSQALITFVQRITEFQCANEMRRHYRQKKHNEELSEQVLDWPDARGDPLALMLQKEERVEVLKILAALNNQSRQLLFLKYYQELSCKEIAELTGLTEGSVRVSIYRCLKKTAEIAKKLALN